MILAAESRLIPITDHSCIADARRRVGVIAQEIGFDATRRGQIEIVTTELATNLHLHAGGGFLLVRTQGLQEGIEVLAVDRGRGMTNLAECLRDGFSTAGTAGNGLGAIRRLSQVFDIYTKPDHGTVVMAQLYRTTPPPQARYVVGAVNVPVEGETVSGDAWGVVATAHGVSVVMADGLGHGPEAALASQKAIGVIAGMAGQGLSGVLQGAHRAIAATRGAAVAICDIDFNAGTLRYAGVGNISGQVITAERMQAMVSHNGIVGHQLYKAQEFNYPWPKSALLVMFSDGLVSRLTLDGAAGLRLRHPSLIAAVLYRDFRRGRDDASVVVLRELA